MRKVAVIFGGTSCEREISILTGVLAMNLIDRERFEPVAVYFHSDGKAYSSPQMSSVDFFKEFDGGKCSEVVFLNGELHKLKRGKLKAFAKPAVALNCCHGGWGEGGGVAGLMQQNGIPFASPEMAQSGIFLDKSLTKLILRGLEVPTLDYMRVEANDYKKRGKFLLKNIGSRFGFPVVVKPASLGSSIGITLAGTEEETEMALQTAFLLDDLVIIERYLEGKLDVNCAVCKKNGEIFVSEPEIASKTDGIYSFEAKYLTRNGLLNGKGRGQVREIDDRTAEKIKAYSRMVYKRTGLKGVVRMDYLVAEKQVYLSEINTVPGSLAYYLFCERLTDGKRFLTDLLLEAITKSKEPPKLCPKTGVLDGLTFARK